MSDVEKKRQILTYTTFMRKQYLKLLVLVKWAESAKDIQMCQVKEEGKKKVFIKLNTCFPLYYIYIEYYGLFS